MSTQITTAFVKQFDTNVQLLVQQMGSRTRNAVTLESGKVGEEVFMEITNLNTLRVTGVSIGADENSVITFQAS